MRVGYLHADFLFVPFEKSVRTWPAFEGAYFQKVFVGIRIQVEKAVFFFYFFGIRRKVVILLTRLDIACDPLRKYLREKSAARLHERPFELARVRRPSDRHRFLRDERPVVHLLVEKWNRDAR